MDAKKCNLDACKLLDTAHALVENKRYDINCNNIGFCGFSKFYFSEKTDKFNVYLRGKYISTIKFIQHVCHKVATTSTSTSTSTTSTTSTTTVIPKQLRIATGLIYENPIVLPIVLNIPIILNVPIVIGFNYFFISIPKGYNKIIRNSISIDVTSEFLNIGDDIVVGYADNDILKYSIQFYTGIASTFTLTLS